MDLLNKEGLQKLIYNCDAQEKLRAEAMPTEQDALIVLFEAYQRLKELGWKQSMYAPRDGRKLEFIEAGSTGIHQGYCEDRPTTDLKSKWFWVMDDDLWPSSPILYREWKDKVAE